MRRRSTEAAELLDDAMPALEDLEHRYMVADRAGIMVTEGNELKEQTQKGDVLVELDPFWQARLDQIDHRAAGADKPADLVRTVLKNFALGVDRINVQMRSERVGVTGDEMLDLPQTWVEGAGWFFSDDKECKAFDEIHWLNMDKQGQKTNLTAAKRSRRTLERLMLHIGIDSAASDDEIREKAQRTFSFFDDDGSGKISIAELAKALESLGLVLPEQEMRELVADMDTDGDGEISLEEFQSMVLKTLRGFIDGDGDATGSQHLQEYERRYMQVGPRNNEYNP